MMPSLEETHQVAAPLQPLTLVLFALLLYSVAMEMLTHMFDLYDHQKELTKSVFNSIMIQKFSSIQYLYSVLIHTVSFLFIEVIFLKPGSARDDKAKYCRVPDQTTMHKHLWKWAPKALYGTEITVRKSCIVSHTT